MIIKNWNDLPECMKVFEVQGYYNILEKKRVNLMCIRFFDIIISLILLIVLLPFFLVVSILIVLDSSGGPFFRQTRVTQYGREFKIIKFRSMVRNAECKGAQVTVNNDMRVTRVGRVIRKCRLDEIPQLLNILVGDMTFVGTRPEVPKYVNQYSPEMRATLLLPAGVTSLASIRYKDECKLLAEANDAEKVYIEEILPQKMQYNLKEIKEYGLWHNSKVILLTILAVLERE